MMPEQNVAIEQDVATEQPFAGAFPWDNLFKTMQEGLDLPDVSAETAMDPEAMYIIQHSYYAFETLKKRDKEYIEIMRTPGGSEELKKINDKDNAKLRDLFIGLDKAQEGLSKQNETSDIIKSRIWNADESQFSELPEVPISSYTEEQMDTWVKRRIAQFPAGVHFGEDVDLTLTETADYLNQIPGSIHAENYMAHEKHGREMFPAMHVRYWGEAIDVLRNVFTAIGKRVPLRPGVEDFFRMTNEKNISHSIISANFRPFVEGVISKLPFNNITSITAVESNDITATYKNIVMQQKMLENPDRAFIYIGDGSSDAPAIREGARHMTAFYMALENGGFHHILKTANVPFYTYRNFHDVIRILQRLEILV